jgi:hypothetical protein
VQTTSQAPRVARLPHSSRTAGLDDRRARLRQVEQREVRAAAYAARLAGHHATFVRAFNAEMGLGGSVRMATLTGVNAVTRATGSPRWVALAPRRLPAAALRVGPRRRPRRARRRAATARRARRGGTRGGPAGDETDPADGRAHNDFGGVDGPLMTSRPMAVARRPALGAMGSLLPGVAPSAGVERTAVVR